LLTTGDDGMGGRRPRNDVTGDRRPRPIWLGALDHVIVLAAAAATISLTYILFVVMSEGLAAPLIAGSVLEGLRRNVEMTRQAFLWALWIALLGAMVRYYRAESVGYVSLLVGLSCSIVLPWLIRSRVPASSAPELAEVARSLVQSFQTAGGMIVVLGFLRIVVGRVVLLSTAPSAGAMRRLPGFASAMADLPQEPIGGGRPSLMRKCWELHFCRGSLRVSCPRYLEQVACWKRRSGCYCDHGLATRLLDSVGAKVKVQVSEEMQTVHSRERQRQREPTAPKRRPRTQGKRRKPACGTCPIYLDHQKFKYRALSWLAYPAAAAIIGLTLARIRYGYEWVDSYLGEIFSAPLPLIPYSRPLQEAQWLSAENVIITLIGVVVAATILQLTELAVFRLKL